LFDNLGDDITSYSINWVNEEAVTPVQNAWADGTCKVLTCCYSDSAFASVGAIQSAYKIAGNSLLELSVQQVVDCSTSNGCIEGTSYSAYTYAKSNKLY
jgi:cathepsin K